MEQVIQVTCPSCGTKETLTVNPILNVVKKPEVYDKLINGELFSYTCPNDKTKSVINYPALYINPSYPYAIYLDTRWKDSPEKSEAYLEGLLGEIVTDASELDPYHLRTVTQTADLVEKISIFEANLDDQVIEVVKLLTDELFRQQFPNDSIKARYYFKDEDNSNKFVYITENNNLNVDVNKELVSFVKKKYKKELAYDYRGRFIKVDDHWAQFFLAKEDPK